MRDNGGRTQPDDRRLGRAAPGTGGSKNRSAQITSRYVSIKFAAERASVSKDTIRRMIADGNLPAYRFRGQIRIAVEDVDKAMRPLR